MKILLCANAAWNIRNYRWGLVQALREDGHQVAVVAPVDGTAPDIAAAGVPVHDLAMSRAGTNPLADLALLGALVRVYRTVAPDVVLHYTIKPNIYGTLAAHRLGIPSIANVAGLGTAFEKAGPLRFLAERLYRFAFRRAAWVFFQNPDDREHFLRRRLVPADRAGLLPGSGVDTLRFWPPAGQREPGPARFLLAARLLRDKGIGEYVEAGRRLRADGLEAELVLAGPIDPASPSAVPEDQIRGWSDDGLVTYTGYHADIRGELARADCVVLPSYYREGVPRSLLEAASMARPIITTDSVGCREAVEDGVTGYLVRPRDAGDLAQAMRRFLALGEGERAVMGAAGRAKMLRDFDESIVIDRYREAIAQALIR